MALITASSKVIIALRTRKLQMEKFYGNGVLKPPNAGTPSLIRLIRNSWINSSSAPKRQSKDTSISRIHQQNVTVTWRLLARAYFRRMNKYLLLLVVSVMLSTSCRESKDPTAFVKRQYAEALKYQDVTSQQLLLNELILLDSTNWAYKDSLSRLYIREGNYEGGLLLAEAVLNAGKGNNKLKELAGVAYQQVFQLQKSNRPLQPIIQCQQ